MYEALAIEQIGIAVFFVILSFLLLAVFIPRRSYTYRKVLADLYIAGRIRQLATEDKIDLTIENELFKKYCKKQRIEEQDLDNTIEEDMQDRITDKQVKK